MRHKDAWAVDRALVEHRQGGAVDLDHMFDAVNHGMVKIRLGQGG